MIKTVTRPAFRDFKRAALDMPAAQSRVWSEVQLVLRQSSYWGVKAKNVKLEDFEITDFETYRETLNEMQSERVSRLSGDPIIYWAESGGTSGPAKLFPLTQRYRKQFQRTMGPYLHANSSRFSGFGDKPVIYLASTLPQRHTSAGIDIGYISIFNYQNIPWPLNQLYVFPLDVFKNSETFRNLAPVFAAATDISAIFAITPVKVEQFWELIWKDRDRVLRTLRGPQNKKRISAQRLAHIEKVFSLSNPSFYDLWPSLKVVGCWKTSSCALQLKNLQKYLQGQTSVADAIYSATEGWTTVPIEGETGGVLHAGAHVVEFHDASQTVDKKTLLKPWQLEAGKDYEIFLTTAMGFVRYRLYDILRCTGHWNGAPILEFRQKAGQQISLGTMRVTEAELVSCMDSVGFVPNGAFCYAPNKNGNGLIFICSLNRDASVEIQTKIDKALQDLSFYYRRDRSEGVVKQIDVLRLPETDKFWQRSGHAQEKPRILTQQLPEGFVFT